MPEKLLKVFTRDFSLFITQWWTEAQKDNFERMLGTGYTDMPAVSNGLAVSCFYLERDWEAVKKAILAKLGSDTSFYLNRRVAYIENVRNARSWLGEMHDAKELDPAIIENAKRLFFGLYPVLRMTYAIPSHLADDVRKLGGKAEETISTAYKDRAETEGVFEAIDALLRRLVEAKLRKLGKPAKLAKFLTAEELDSLAAGNEIEWGDAAARTGGFTLCKRTVYATVDYLKLFSENGYPYTEEKVQGNHVTGTVAYEGGTVKGKVRKVFALDQIAGFKEGEVLVCPMTVPDFVPAMKKAAAIVTDEGGMACHAAIVSRELKVPCIVGTKVATKLFLDGDVAKVDTHRGTATKIDQNKYIGAWKDVDVEHIKEEIKKERR